MDQPKMIIRAVALDVDGLLTDTEGSIQYAAWDHVLAARGHTLSRKEYCHSYVGDDSRSLAEKFIEQFDIKASPAELLSERKAEIQRLLHTQPISPMPYAPEAIKLFGEAGLPIAISTGGSLEETQFKLDKSGLLSIISPYNPKYITRDNVPAGKGKPDPTTYLIVAKTLRISPEQIAAFEDSYPGYVSARDAGLVAFAVPSSWTIKRFPSQKGHMRSLEAATRELTRNYMLVPIR